MDARRNDGADDGRSCRDSCCELRSVARFLHGLNLNPTQPCSIRGGRSGDSRKDHAPENVHMTQSPTDVPHQGQGKIEDPVGYPRAVHQFPDEDIERHSQECIAVDPFDHRLGNNREVHSLAQKIKQGGQEEGDGDGASQRQEDAEGKQQKANRTHRNSLPFLVPDTRSFLSGRMRPRETDKPTQGSLARYLKLPEIERKLLEIPRDTISCPRCTTMRDGRLDHQDNETGSDHQAHQQVHRLLKRLREKGHQSLDPDMSFPPVDHACSDETDPHHQEGGQIQGPLKVDPYQIS